MIPSAEMYTYVTKFQKDRGVDLFDPDSLSEEDWKVYYDGLADLEKKHGKSEPAEDYADRPDEYFQVKVNSYTLDGLEQSTIDVRELSDEQLSKFVERVPEYAGYYTYRLFKK